MSAVSLEARPIQLSGQLGSEADPFPFIIQCQTEGTTLERTEEWIKGEIQNLLERSHVSGAILFRGFPVKTAEDFDRFIAAFGLENFPYEDSLSNAVRVNRTPRVFTANEAPPNIEIFLHHEMAQTPRYPAQLFFFCEKAAEQGGATPICRSDLLWGELEKACPEFARNCVEHGLKYSNVMPEENDPESGMGRSWKSTLKASTRDEAEQRLRKLGYRWEWLENGCLRATTPVLPAVHELSSGRRSFFNQLIAAFRGWKDARNDPSKAIFFGDGQPLDPEAVQVALDLSSRFTFDIPWQTGDVALVDNLVAMHGRRTFSGTRKVLASLVSPNF